jgi:hypothetical protein
MLHDDGYRSSVTWGSAMGGVYVPPATDAHVTHYPIQGFRGAFRNAAGKLMVAELQPPAGRGDGTVPFSSANTMFSATCPKPGNAYLKLEHQPAYESSDAQHYTIKAITALCKKHIEQ